MGLFVGVNMFHNHIGSLHTARRVHISDPSPSDLELFVSQSYRDGLEGCTTQERLAFDDEETRW